MQQRKKSIGAVLVAAAVMGGFLFAGPANAAEGWSRDLECGTNYRCAMNSNTSAGVSYYVDGALKVSWGTGGAHSWSGPIGAGAHTASMGTSGTFTSHTARCYCPSGTSCAV